MKHNLTDIEFSSVCKVIASQLGLNFPINRQAMVSRSLASAAIELGFHNMRVFIHWLLTNTLNADQVEILASYLTISETYFWRESQVFVAFSQNILPELVSLKKDNGKSINIWCAGCSTGEEAYSIAIALYRTVPDIKDWKITILATDINTKVLGKARTGVYGSWSFRNSPLWLKNRYMNRLVNQEWEVIPEIKKMVTFSSFNLIRGNYLSSICKNNKIDIIFCRNVLMYFTREWAAKVSQNLSDCLSEEGWLVVASCELSSELFPQLKPVNFPGAVLYRKTIKEELEPLKYFQPINPSILQPVQPVQPSSSNFRHIRHHQPLLKTREDSLNENKISVRLLADKGQLEEALLLCNKAIANDKLAPGLYYLRASILQEQNRSLEAIKSLKQAIYIDPDYIMGHFTLGNLFSRQGIIKNAKRYFNNALELLNTISNDDIPAESDGLSAKYIREIILDNLQIQKSI